MKRSDIHPMPEYFDRYINRMEDIELMDALHQSLEEIENFPVAKWLELGDKVYAPGKWTVRDTIQHLIDTERIFSYRSMCFARNDKSEQPFIDEALHASFARANDRKLEDIIEEYKVARRSFIMLFSTFNDEELQRTAVSFKGGYNVLSIGFMIPGHQRHHIKLLEDKYYPLM